MMKEFLVDAVYLPIRNESMLPVAIKNLKSFKVLKFMKLRKTLGLSFLTYAKNLLQVTLLKFALNREDSYTQ